MQLQTGSNKGRGFGVKAKMRLAWSWTKRIYKYIYIGQTTSKQASLGRRLGEGPPYHCKKWVPPLKKCVYHVIPSLGTAQFDGIQQPL